MQSKMRLAGLLAVIAGCNASGGQSAHTALTSEMVAGCYRFSWRRSDSLLQDRPFYPDLVRLGSESSCPQCESDAPAAKYLSLGSPLPDTARYEPGKPIPWYREFYASWWRIAVPDTVVVIFNGNVVRWDVRLFRTNGALRGRANWWDDGGGGFPPTDVTAVPASCAIAA